jgi:uncharacterized membrane protein
VPQPHPRVEIDWRKGALVYEPRCGYLQQLDDTGLASWAAKNRAAVRLLVRPGDYIFPGTPVAVVVPEIADAEKAVNSATALGSQRISSADLEFAMRQLVEVAVRALSPGINGSPYGGQRAELPWRLPVRCGAPQRHSPAGRPARARHADGQLRRPDRYMFHLIRQNAAGSVTVLIRMLEVLTATLGCERDPARLATLQRHADLVLGDAEQSISTPADLAELRARHARFGAIRQNGPFHLVA